MNIKNVINKMLRKSISIPYFFIKRVKKDGIDYFGNPQLDRVD